MNIVYEHYRIDRITGELKRYHRGCSQLSRSDPGTWSPAERGGRTICIILPEGETMETCMEWKQSRKARPTAFQQMAKGEWR